MPQQQQQRVCTPMVVVAFVIGCQVAVMVMHAGRHDAHVAREGKRWHRNDFAAPAVPLPTERAPPPATPERRTPAAVPATPERRAEPPERRATEPSQRSAADSTRQKTQLSACLLYTSPSPRDRG